MPAQPSNGFLTQQPSQGRTLKAKSSMLLLPSTQIHSYSAIEGLIIAMSLVKMYGKYNGKDYTSIFDEISKCPAVRDRMSVVIVVEIDVAFLGFCIFYGFSPIF